jgi:hypothetical protein
MGKRSDFLRKPRDAYDTPMAAVLPLLPYLKPGCRYGELCAGRGLLIDNLASHGFTNVGYAGDIKPRSRSTEKRDALTVTAAMMDRLKVDLIITNPPHSREIMHELIRHFISLRPSWLLIDADWMQTKQAGELIKRCAKVVAIGRLKWIEGSKHTGKDNYCWHYFPRHHHDGPVFIGREEA